MADHHYDLVPPANGSVPPRRGRIASPLQDIARHHDRAGDEPVGAALIVPANVDEQRAHGLGFEGLGRRQPVGQKSPRLGQQLFHFLCHHHFPPPPQPG